jgi:hypothetical protein
VGTGTLHRHLAPCRCRPMAKKRAVPKKKAAPKKKVMPAKKQPNKNRGDVSPDRPIDIGPPGSPDTW